MKIYIKDGNLVVEGNPEWDENYGSTAPSASISLEELLRALEEIKEKDKKE